MIVVHPPSFVLKFSQKSKTNLSVHKKAKRSDFQLTIVVHLLNGSPPMLVLN